MTTEIRFFALKSKREKGVLDRGDEVYLNLHSKLGKRSQARIDGKILSDRRQDGNDAVGRIHNVRRDIMDTHREKKSHNRDS